MFDEPRNELEVINYVRRRLGDQVVNVELTEDQLRDCINDTKRWFVANWGVRSEKLIIADIGQSEFKLEEDVYRVIAVYEERLAFPGIALSFQDIPFYYLYTYRSDVSISFSYPVGLYSGLIQQLQFIGQLKRIFSADLSFEYNPYSRILRIMPARMEARRILVEYLNNTVDIAKLAGEDKNVFLRYCLAVAKERLGRIRSKYSDIPYATGTVSLDGERLLSEALEEQKELTEWAMSRNKPALVLRG